MERGGGGWEGDLGTAVGCQAWLEGALRSTVHRIDNGESTGTFKVFVLARRYGRRGGRRRILLNGEIDTSVSAKEHLVISCLNQGISRQLRQQKLFQSRSSEFEILQPKRYRSLCSTIIRGREYSWTGSRNYQHCNKRKRVQGCFKGNSASL